MFVFPTKIVLVAALSTLAGCSGSVPQQTVVMALMAPTLSVRCGNWTVDYSSVKGIKPECMSGMSEKPDDDHGFAIQFHRSDGLACIRSSLPAFAESVGSKNCPSEDVGLGHRITTK